jgi:hypothetical protein
MSVILSSFVDLPYSSDSLRDAVSEAHSAKHLDAPREALRCAQGDTLGIGHVLVLDRICPICYTHERREGRRVFAMLEDILEESWTYKEVIKKGMQDYY